MKVVLLTGSHPRHLFLARTLHQAGLLDGLLIEQREQFVPKPPPHLNQTDHDNFIRHFHDRDEAEQKFFGNSSDVSLGVPVLKVEKNELNSETTKKWIAAQKADVVITYGVHKISNDMLEAFRFHSWNIHGGLSPWFRGNITLFWPFYFLKP
ncbi:MAG TPA: methionyl-tRNA formyltransferase, partial [Bacillales bacterium]